MNGPGIVRHINYIELPEDVLPAKEPEQRFERGDGHVRVQQVVKHTRSTIEAFTELTISVDQVDPDGWPAFSKMIQELRPHLFKTVRIPVVVNSIH